MQPVHPIFTKLDKLLCSLFEKHAYKPSTIRTYERNLQLVEDYLSQRGTDYCPDIGNEFSLEYVSLNSAVQSRCTSMKRTIRRLNDCYYGKGIVLMPQKERKSLPNDFEMALSQYSIWCAENGNAPSTIKKKMYALQCFFQNLVSMGCESVSGLNRTFVSRACLMASDQNHWLTIKGFLSFLSEHGETDRDYSYIVPSRRRSFRLPSTYSREEILKTRQSIDTSSPKGKRDLCMFLMASWLGMRSIDIARITFESLDFQKDSIHFVQQKTQEPISLPMPEELKTAILDYMNSGRPESEEPFLFLRSLAPYLPLDPSAVSISVGKYLKKAGIDTTGRKHGAHSLRSSLATSLINNGMTYEETRRVLGHTEANAVRHYAVLDVERLRQCACAVPEPAGFFKDFLEGKVVL